MAPASETSGTSETGVFGALVGVGGRPLKRVHKGLGHDGEPGRNVFVATVDRAVLEYVDGPQPSSCATRRTVALSSFSGFMVGFPSWHSRISIRRCPKDPRPFGS